MAGELVEEWSELLRAIAHPTRMMILMELKGGMKCVNDIQELVEIPQPNVSQHLAVLKETGLVMSHKDGVSRCYHLAKPGFVEDLFAVLGRDYPTVKGGDPEFCRALRQAQDAAQGVALRPSKGRAARKPRRRPRPARHRRAASKT